MHITICKIDNQCKFNAWSRAPKAGALDNPEGWDGEGGGRGVQDGGTDVHPWLIHVEVWQKPPQYCNVISLQLNKFFKKEQRVMKTAWKVIEE